MSAAQYTPGPWSVGGKYTHKTVLLNAKGESIASGGNNRSVVGEELEASLILASAAPPSAVHPGWKLVPIEPTPEMWKAGLAHLFRDVDAVWRAMLAEVPEAPK